MLWLFPIEPIAERYSAQWLPLWAAELSRLRVSFRLVMGERLTEKIETGQFLDAYDTNYWKATQLAQFAKHMHQSDVKRDDVVLLLDAWNPCIEQLAYMRQGGKVPFKIAGLLHAGTWDLQDYLSQVGCGYWGRKAELAWLRIMDATFVATEFHRSLLVSAFDEHECGRIEVTGFPLPFQDLSEYTQPWEARRPLVVFPHRLAPEKQPAGFDVVRRIYEQKYGVNAEWVRSKDVCKDKEAYYRLLGGARCVFSSALQETWGIAMLEGCALGAHPVAPNRLSYPETMPQSALYTNFEHAADLIHTALNADEPAAIERPTRWTTAIGNMIAKL